MEELKSERELEQLHQLIALEFDVLVNQLVELINCINVELRKEKNIDNLKKEILSKLIISIKHDLEKNILPCLSRIREKDNREVFSKIRESASFGKVGEVVAKCMLCEYFKENIKIINELCYFDDLGFLNHINGFLDTNRASLQLASCLNLYSDLKDFANSGIDEKHYYDEIKSIIKKADSIQKFSISPINLDNLPKHPTDIIRDFYSHEIFDNCELEIVQKALDKTGAIFKNLYKKKPNATIKEKKIISQFGDMNTYKIKKILSWAQSQKDTMN